MSDEKRLTLLYTGKGKGTNKELGYTGPLGYYGNDLFPKGLIAYPYEL